MIDNGGLKVITKEDVAKMKKLSSEVKKVTDEIPEGTLEWFVNIHNAMVKDGTTDRNGININIPVSSESGNCYLKTTIRFDYGGSF